MRNVRYGGMRLGLSHAAIGLLWAFWALGAERIPRSFEDISALEAKLLRAYDALQSGEYNTRRMVAYARWKTSDPAYDRIMNAGRRAHAEVHALLDELTIAQMNYTMDAAARISSELSREFEGQLPKAELRRLRALNEKLQGFHAKLLGPEGQRKMLEYYGTMGSPVLHKNLVGLMETFTQEAELLDRIVKERGFVGSLRGLAERAGRTLVLARQVSRIGSLDEKARLASFLARAAGDGVPPQKLNGRSFVGALTESVRSFARAEGYSVEVNGRELLTSALKASEANCVNIVVPTHQVPRPDLVMMSHLMDDDFLLFAASNDFMPKGKGPLVGKQSFIVDVGRGKEPVKSALEKIKAGLSRNILMYPQAYTSFGYAETRPPVPGFTDFVRALIANGYQVRVIPVTYEVGAPASVDPAYYGLVGHELSKEEKRLVATVHKPWDPPMVKKLVASRDDNHLRWLLRSEWISTMPTDDDHVLGQFRLRAFNERLLEGFGRGLAFSRCREILRRVLRARP